jgi:hypothetical protein
LHLAELAEHESGGYRKKRYRGDFANGATFFCALLLFAACLTSAAMVFARVERASAMEPT